jgi:hypothetical protein
MGRTDLIITKITNMAGEFEYINLEQVVDIEVHNDHYHLDMTDGSTAYVPLTETQISSLLPA